MAFLFSRRSSQATSVSSKDSKSKRRPSAPHVGTTSSLEVRFDPNFSFQPSYNFVSGDEVKIQRNTYKRKDIAPEVFNEEDDSDDKTLVETRSISISSTTEKVSPSPRKRSLSIFKSSKPKSSKQSSPQVPTLPKGYDTIIAQYHAKEALRQQKEKLLNKDQILVHNLKMGGIW